jgi:hypothetical protein
VEKVLEASVKNSLVKTSSLEFNPEKKEKFSTFSSLGGFSSSGFGPG